MPEHTLLFVISLIVLIITGSLLKSKRISPPLPARIIFVLLAVGGSAGTCIGFLGMLIELSKSLPD